MLDFDNTIVSYDTAFKAAAERRGLPAAVARGPKRQIRDSVRLLPDGEHLWQQLQADVYGDAIVSAAPFPGVDEFIVRARSLGMRPVIVSHKTQYATLRPRGPDLRVAANSWLVAKGIVGKAAVAPMDVFFTATCAEKILCIRKLSAVVAVDDLLEVLTADAFPTMTRRWLFAPGDAPSLVVGIETFASWHAMTAEMSR